MDNPTVSYFISHLKKDKARYLKVMKCFATDEYIVEELKKDPEVMRRFLEAAMKDFGTENVNEVQYDPNTDSYLISPNEIPTETRPDTKL